MQAIINFFTGTLNTVAWLYIFLPCTILGGLYLTIRNRGIQFTKFGYTMKNTLGKMFQKQEAGSGAVTPVQAVTTALAATVGTGNIVGTSQAIALGGYGAVFWLWLAALLGMMIKYSEVVLQYTGKADIFMDLCNINENKALLARHGFHFSKAKGQNFLTQNWVPREIVARAGIDETCAALEVGPGIGPLTQELCRSAKKVIAIEVDRSLQPVLAETMAGNENLEIIFGDVLKTDIRALVAEEFAGLRPVACANLPYYITTPILAALLESRAFESITVMVQKEVAQRIAAPAGKGDYGAFSVFCQYYAVPELLFDVPPSCFIPQPKVTSAVLKLTMRTEPVCEIRDEALFFRTVKAAFAQRRKTLLNALSAGFGELSKAELAELIEESGFAPTVRGETLDIPSFASLANAIAERKS